MGRKGKRWRWVTGQHGAKVVAFERVPGGALYLGIPRVDGGYDRESLGHTDRAMAMQEAERLAARRRAGGANSGPLTLAPLFALYLEAVSGKQSAQHARNTKRSAALWTRWLGPDFKVERFGASEWEGFQRLRSSGELDAQGRIVTDPSQRKPAGPRTVARDLKMLRAACRRATIERTNTGAFLLAADPTRGLAVPVQKNPARPCYDGERFDRLMAVADQVSMLAGFGKYGKMRERSKAERSHLRSILRLAADTGRRVSSILALEWTDWKPDLGTYGKLRWRAEEDKVGREWLSPVTPEVRAELEALRRDRMAVGLAAVFLFPSVNDTTASLSYKTATLWLRAAEKLAGLEPLPHGAWHPFRRRWASERKHLPLSDVAAAGGWVETTTLQRCYIQADEETLETVVLTPKRLGRKLG
jgi:integrase